MGGEKSYVSDFDSGMIAGARRSSLNISVNVDVCGFSHTTVSIVYLEWWNKEKTAGLAGLYTKTSQ